MSAEKVIFVRNHKPLTVEEMRSAFSVEENHPLWRGVMDVIQNDLDDYIVMVTDSRLARDHGGLANAAGSLDALISLRTKLMELRKASTRMDEVKK